MAGDWIKIEVNTPYKPEVLQIARRLRIDRDAAFGKVVRMWAWFDANSVDGVVDGVVSTDVDALVDAQGFAGVVQSVGWLEFDDENERVVMPKFDRHNGQSAKKRALSTARQSRWRSKRVDGGASTGASTREEKRRDTSSKDDGAAAPSVWDLWVAAGGNRSLLGKLIKDHGEERALQAAQDTLLKRPADPNSYIKGVIRPRGVQV